MRRSGRGRLGPAVDAVGQRAALDVFEGEERPAALVADTVNLDDVGVPQPRDGLGLGPKPLHIGRTGMAAREDHLEGHHPVEIHLPGLVHHSHAAPAQFSQDLVTRHARQLRLRALFRHARRQRCLVVGGVRTECDGSGLSAVLFEHPGQRRRFQGGQEVFGRPGNLGWSDALVANGASQGAALAHFPLMPVCTAIAVGHWSLDGFTQGVSNNSRHELPCKARG